MNGNCLEIWKFKMILIKNFSLILIIWISSIDCANILAIFPSVWKSNYLFGRSILIKLIEREHNVTLINGFNNFSKENLTEIKLNCIEKNWHEMGMNFNYDKIREKSIMERFTKSIYAGISNVDSMLASNEIQHLMQSDQNFDLLIIDPYLSDALLGLGLYYDIPVIALSPSGTNKWLNEMTGNPHNSAWNPNSFLPLMENMNLWERIINTLMTIFEKLTYNFLYLPNQEAIYHRYFDQLIENHQKLPYLSDLIRNVNLVLINSHPIVQYPRPFITNMIEIGGAHINRNMTNLSQVFKTFLNEAPNGIIYISFGANLRTIDLPKDKLDALIGVIEKLRGNMRVLLKWENDKMENQPSNTVIAKWLPQQEILAHPNVKLFILYYLLQPILS